ncbi:MAG: hypothetical protein KA436_06330 [Oligoflexales bacterium]|nr:hypothetical protein [Oligoflexales bacterium]
MNQLFKYILYLLAGLSLCPYSGFARFSHNNNRAPGEDGTGLVYIYATGPELYDPSRSRTLYRQFGRYKFTYSSWPKEYESSYAKGVIRQLINKIGIDHPGAVSYHLTDFRPESLQRLYDQLRKSPEEILQLVLIITAHGGFHDGIFDIRTYGRSLTSAELGEIIGSTPTETVLFTCHSGAVQLKDFPGPVFGSSYQHTSMDAEHFYEWVEMIQEAKKTKFPVNAKEFYESWLKSMIQAEFYEKSQSVWYRVANWLQQTTWQQEAEFIYKQALLENRVWVRDRPFWYSTNPNSAIPTSEP